MSAFDAGAWGSIFVVYSSYCWSARSELGDTGANSHVSGSAGEEAMKQVLGREETGDGGGRNMLLRRGVVECFAWPHAFFEMLAVGGVRGALCLKKGEA